MLLGLAVFLLILVYVIAFLFQFPVVRASGAKRDVWVYWIFMIFSFMFLLAFVLNLRLPNPTDLINKLISNFARKFMEINETLP